MRNSLLGAWLAAFALGLLLLDPCCVESQSTSPAPDKSSAQSTDGLSADELARLRPVVERDLREMLSRAYNIRNATAKDLDDEFKQCRFTRLGLGKLGAGVLVEHGVTNKNEEMINLYVPRSGSYRRMIAEVGFGPILVRESREVPDLVFGGTSGICETSLTRYRYSKGKYVADACDQEYRGDSTGDGACPVRRCEAKPNLPTFPNPLHAAEAAQSH